MDPGMETKLKHPLDCPVPIHHPWLVAQEKGYSICRYRQKGERCMITTETDLATSFGKRHSMFSPLLSQDVNEDYGWQMALNGKIDIASFDHRGAWLSMHSVCPRSH
jgi:hypothetical protein